MNAKQDRTEPKLQGAQTPETQLTEELSALRAEIKLLNRHRIVRLFDSPTRLLSFQFVRGLAFGLGSVVGATALVSVAVYFLSQINFIPIIGDWATEIAEQIKAGQEE